MGQRGVVLHNFLGPDFDVGADHGVVADFGAIGQDAILANQRRLADADTGGAYRLGDACPRAHPAILPEHDIAKFSAFIDDATGTDHGILQNGAHANVHVAAEHHRTGQLHIAANGSAGLAPYARAIQVPFLSRHAQGDRTTQHVIVGVPVFIQVANVTPVAFGDVSVESR